MSGEALAAHWLAAYKHARRFCRDRQDAEDAVQSGYLHLLRRLAEGKAWQPGRGLVCQFARYAALHISRRERVRWKHGGTPHEEQALLDQSETGDHDHLLVPEAALAHDEYADPYERQRVREALTAMRRKDAALLVAFYVDEMTCRELATEAGCSEDAMEMRIRRARKAFRLAYAE